MGAAFYRNAECCVLVFDLTDPKTFETVDTWRSEFLTQLNPKDPENFPFVLLGNKSDKQSDRKVSEQKIKQYCQQKGNMAYYETSAKDNTNVEKSFEDVARLAFKRDQKEDDMYFTFNFSYLPKSVDLSKPKNTTKTGGGCC